MSFKIKNNGSWIDPKDIKVKDSTWKSAKKAFIKANGVWKEVWSSYPSVEITFNLRKETSSIAFIGNSTAYRNNTIISSSNFAEFGPNAELNFSFIRYSSGAWNGRNTILIGFSSVKDERVDQYFENYNRVKVYINNTLLLEKSPTTTRTINSNTSNNYKLYATSPPTQGLVNYLFWVPFYGNNQESIDFYDGIEQAYNNNSTIKVILDKA